MSRMSNACLQQLLHEIQKREKKSREAIYCGAGAGDEATRDQCDDTPGFKLRNSAAIVKDDRQFLR